MIKSWFAPNLATKTPLVDILESKKKKPEKINHIPLGACFGTVVLRS